MKTKTFLFFGALILSLSGLYIFQINSLTASAYGATVSERETGKLKQETALLETNAGDTLASDNFTSLALALHFEKVDSIQYVQTIEGAVAKK